MAPTTVMTVRLTPELREQYIARAEAEGRSVNALIVRVLAQAASRWTTKKAATD